MRSSSGCRLSRGSAAVQCLAIERYVSGISSREIVKGESSTTLRADFLGSYLAWLADTRSLSHTGLKSFGTQYYVNGVTQAYDIFFFEHKGRRFRTVAGEYPYTRLSIENWASLEDPDDIQRGDAVVLTLPFYVNGSSPVGLERILDQCAALDVPVFIDAAYFGTCYDVHFDYSHPAIDMIGFSLSKVFSVPSYRIGLLAIKRKLPYLEEIQVASNYYNRIGAYVGLRLLKRFSSDYVVSRFRRKHDEVCAGLGLIPTSCIMLGSVRGDDHRFDDILRDDRFLPEALPGPLLRRICVSAYVSDEPSYLRRAIRQILRR